MQLFPTLCSFGAAQKVTGSKHLITTVTGEKILLDCGLFQGEGKDSDALNRHWGFEPREIDYVILSHAHIDHTGLLPKLVKDGFTGPIFCNSGTKDLCEIMLLDGAFIQKSDLQRINRRRRERHELPIEALYDESDVYQTLEQMVVVANGRPFKVGETTWATYILNAHILGNLDSIGAPRCNHGGAWTNKKIRKYGFRFVSLRI
jgi:metallo-beta-lactamase family protein